MPKGARTHPDDADATEAGEETPRPASDAQSVGPAAEQEVEQDVEQDVQFDVLQDVELVEQDLDELTERARRADEYLALAQRTHADFENFRKRASRDAALAQERGVARLAKELLPAIDNLERAIAAHPETPEGSEANQILEGIKLVHADLLAALGRVGIESFSPAGEPFDPQYHEAVAQHRVEGVDAGAVLEVYQQGYRQGELVLRPARVLVAA